MGEDLDQHLRFCSKWIFVEILLDRINVERMDKDLNMES